MATPAASASLCPLTADDSPQLPPPHPVGRAGGPAWALTCNGVWAAAVWPLLEIRTTSDVLLPMEVPARAASSTLKAHRFKLPLYPMAKLSPIRDLSLAPGQHKAKQAGLEPLHVSGWSTRQSSHGKPGSHVGSPQCILSGYLRREPTRLSFDEQSPSFLQTSWDSQWPCSQAVYLVFCASDPRTGVPDVWFKRLTTQGGVFYTFTEMIT